jgi:hypothetical protein
MEVFLKSLGVVGGYEVIGQCCRKWLLFLGKLKRLLVRMDLDITLRMGKLA